MSLPALRMIAIAIGAVCMTACTSTQIHVAVTGNDRAPGTVGQPVQSLARALELADTIMHNNARAIFDLEALT